MRGIVYRAPVLFGNSGNSQCNKLSLQDLKAADVGEDVLIDPKAVELGTEKICPGSTCQLLKGKFSTSTGRVGGGM